MTKYIIVLFTDGSFQIYPKANTRKRDFIPTAKFFVCLGKCTVENISTWLSNNCLTTDFIKETNIN